MPGAEGAGPGGAPAGPRPAVAKRCTSRRRRRKLSTIGWGPSRTRNPHPYLLLYVRDPTTPHPFLDSTPKFLSSASSVLHWSGCGAWGGGGGEVLVIPNCAFRVWHRAPRWGETVPPGRGRHSDASACVRRHQAFASPRVFTAGRCRAVVVAASPGQTACHFRCRFLGVLRRAR